MHLPPSLSEFHHHCRYWSPNEVPPTGVAAPYHHADYPGYYGYLSPSGSDVAAVTDNEWRLRSGFMSQMTASLSETPNTPTQDTVSKATDLFDTAFMPDLHHDFEDSKPAAPAAALTAGSDAPGCRCLRMLADQFSHPSSVERRQENPRIDTTFFKMSVILDCSTAALNCPLCVCNSKVLLLVMTLLQTVFGWAKLSFQRVAQTQRLPTISFGDWEVSAEEGSAIQALPGSRVLTKSASTVDILLGRVGEITEASGGGAGGAMSYQVMDAEVLQTTLQRLTQTFRDVLQLAKAVDYDC
jgi:hypothetical protein